MSLPKQLENIKQSVDANESPEETVRTLLGWFEIKRRHKYTQEVVKSALDKLGLETVPDFRFAYYDGLVTFKKKEESSNNNTNHVDEQAVTNSEGFIPSVVNMETFTDATHRVSALPSARLEKSAKKKLIYVKPGTPIAEAKSLILLNNFSQLPVMQSEYKISGIISWQSIGEKEFIGKSSEKVDDYLEKAVVVEIEDSMFSVMQ